MYLRLIKQLNRYLRVKQRDFQLRGGYCHGLALLWLHAMSQNRESIFYQTIADVVACEDDFSRMKDNVETFIAHIEWLQHSSRYEYSINQLDADELTGLQRDGSLSFLMHHAELDELIRHAVQDNKFICISSHNHSVGVVRRMGIIYLFDVNFPELKPKTFHDDIAFKYALIKSLYRRDYLPDVKLPVHVNVLSCQPRVYNNSMHVMYQRLMRSRDELDVPGFERMTNLYLACERGDDVMVRDLLRRNVDPNKRVKTWTPLHVAAAHGHQSVVKALIQFGAITSMKTDHGLTPKDMAEAYRHEDVVKLL